MIGLSEKVCVMDKVKKIKDKKLSAHEKFFLCCILIVPLMQFLIMYVGVNFNSILLAFQRYESPNYVWIGFENFKDFFTRIVSVPFLLRIKNSLFLYLLGIFVGTPFGIIMAYLLWRKVAGYKVFQIILFLPSIVSSMVFVVLARNYIVRVMPYVIGTPADLISNVNTTFWTIALYGSLIGIGTYVIMYLGSMSSINESVVEYAKIDGMGFFREFYYVVFPNIYGTLSTFLVIQIAQFFVNYGSFYSFVSSGLANENQTLGYYYFVEVVNEGKEASYPAASAAGLIFSLIALPLTLLLKKILSILQPKDE